MSVRTGPLAQGWLEVDAVVCPWHSWSFHARTGLADHLANVRVDVFPLRVDGEDVLADVE
jgi:nitrite reductase (NADH) small subunit